MRPIRRTGLGMVALVALWPGFLLPATGAPEAPAPGPPGRPGVVVAVLPTDPTDSLDAGPDGEPRDRLLRAMAAEGFSVGLLSTAQGRYDRQQALVDLTQGTRQPRAIYESDIPALSLEQTDGPWAISNWPELVRRAQRASVTLAPGLLAGQVPGGGFFVGLDPGGDNDAAVAAADRDGSLSGVSFGSETSLVDRVAEARSTHSMVVVGLPPGDSGPGLLVELQTRRAAPDMLLAVQLPPTPELPAVAGAQGSRFYSQAAVAIDAGGPPGLLASESTRQPGLVTTIDLAPTILNHLGVDVPDRMRGQVIRAGGPVDTSRLEEARRRWHDVRSGRQTASLGWIVLMSVAFGLLAAIGGSSEAVRTGLRTLGLGLLWWPATGLAFGAVGIRSGAVEATSIAAVAVLLAIGTDRSLRWPRGALAPVAVGLGLLTIDLAVGGRLLTSSVLAPSVGSGNRFYGISNEIEPVLPILLLTGLAAARLDVRRLRVAYTLGGGALALVVGAGGLGADVGGVITVAVAMVVAGIWVRPGRRRASTVALALAAPMLALGTLVIVDLAFGGGGHLANNLNRLNSGRELWELVARRYQLAWAILLDAGNAVRLILCAVIVGVAIGRRRALATHLPDRAWAAALTGGLAGGLAGAVSNDSGPVLLVHAVVALGAVVAYLTGGPDTATAPEPVSSPLRSGAVPAETAR